MPNLYFPIAGFFCAVLLTVVFLLKKEKLKTKETEIYSCMILSSLIDTIIIITVVFLAYKYYNDFTIILIKLLNKIDFITYIFWPSLLFLYVFYTINKENINIEKKYNTARKIIITLNIIFVIIEFILPLSLYNVNQNMTVYGSAIDFVYVIDILYIISIITILFINFKMIFKKKFIPVFVFVILMIVAAIIRTTNPTLIIIPTILVYINLIMYFTIENPDMKMLEEVNKAKEISDNSNEEKSMFLYNMTNEIRNITREIDKSASDILDEVDKEKVDLEYIDNYARDIKSSTAKFTTITNEILDVSNIDSHNIKVYNNKYNIKLILKEIVNIYQDRCENKGLTFITNIGSDIPDYLYGDSVGIKNAITTILDNSIKYTNKGYIEFSVNTIIKNDIARLIIIIEDSGIGMKYDEIEKLLNKNKEEIEKYNPKNNLYTIKKLITLMGGTLIPSSTYGKGTIMKIILDQKYELTEGNLEQYTKEYDKKKILLVEDTDSGIKIINKLLRDTNIILDNVKLGKEALDKIRNKEKYDLILINEKMKPLSGIEVMQKLKQIRNFNTKVILLTRNIDYENNDNYLKYGFSDYILKPIEKEKIMEKIDKYLN